MAETRAHKRLKKAHPTAHWQRFESWSGVGVFDSNSCKDGREIWVEFKEVKPPKKLTDAWVVKPKVRPSQVAWQALREQAGGITFVALMVGPKMYILPGAAIQWLKHGMLYGHVKQHNIPVEDIYDTNF